MPRRSMSELMISAGPNGVITDRPDAPYDLDDAECEEWRSIVNAMPPGYFARSHYPMLTQLCRHVVASKHIGHLIATLRKDKKKFDAKEYATLLRLQALETGVIVRLERSMRLTQLSVLNHTATKKLRPNITLTDAPWTRKRKSADV